MRKDLIIAVLGTFCLTVTLFTVIPIRSQTIEPYDPWEDLNDDGRIDLYDAVLLLNSYGTTGTPINKTALVLELQAKINALNSTIETRLPKKGYLSISPAEFTPGTYTQEYSSIGDTLWGYGGFYAGVHLPNGVTLTNMTVRARDVLGGGGDPVLFVWLFGFNITSGHSLGDLAWVSTTSLGAPGEVILYDDTIDNAVIDNKNCEYYLEVQFTEYDAGLSIEGIVLEYEYPQ